MNKKTNNLNKYLDNNQVKNFKQVMVKVLFDLIVETDLGYYYSFSKISSIINNKIKKIYITEDDLGEFIKFQKDVLIINKLFSGISFNNKEEINAFILSENWIFIKIKEAGLKVIANENLNPGFKDALAIYFASDRKKVKKTFYDRKYYTGLPFMDLKEKIISCLNIFIDEDILAQTFCLGDINLSKIIYDISNHHGTFKLINKYLDRINIIQTKILNSNLKYVQIEELYYKILIKINSLKQKTISDKQISEETYNINYFDLELEKDEQKKLISIIRIYDLYNESNFSEKQVINNANFVEKLQILLKQTKKEINDYLLMLDKEYILLNNYIVNNILSKYLKNKKIIKEKEIQHLFESLEYEIGNEYSYLEKLKLTKKLKKKLEKKQ